MAGLTPGQIRRYPPMIRPLTEERIFDRFLARVKTCGSLLAALDVHLRVAMQILRRSKIALTMEIYTEVPSAVTRDTLKKLGSWLDT